MAAGTITDEFCGWPYFQPYQFTQKAPRKKRASKRSTIAKDLRTPKYKPRVIPNKKRAAKNNPTG